MDAKAGDSLISAERSRALIAALWFRLAAVVVIAVAAGFRYALPAWMREEFVLIALPLFGYNLAALLGRQRLELILTRYPGWLVVDVGARKTVQIFYKDDKLHG